MKYIRKRMIHLMRCRGMTRRLMNLFLKHDPTLKKMYDYTPTRLNHMFQLPLKNAQSLVKDMHHSTVKRKVSRDIRNYKILTILDQNYPTVLKQIKDPPFVLYMKGDETLLQANPKISIIGTRTPSSEAKKKTKHFIPPLVQQDWTIVSGMALGIDSYAHQFTLEEQGKTIAILGSGFQHIYPKQNIKLFEKIVEKGLVLTEYPPDLPPRRFHFPERNRLISGLSFGTLVIEAQERSGTLITVDQALDQGREVYAVPGSLFTPQTKGCHQMIQDGAKLVIHANDIIEDWQGIGFHLFNS